ncbi:acyl-CoA desaturase [Parasphingopyxis marina]|uniref:Acyl-CoA desaturase n=1 Tax=Parasphingopyxis marina TaxID=2761622 RepID=A0A842HX19_9SPHN|nr:acyl-CoA desaturase [Parasphingopyxis marina]MBC2777656.1 acyl-CoA desaturase [Parasphingopyxis marina]
MMKPVLRIDGSSACAESGKPVLDFPKAVWNGGMLFATVALAGALFTWSAFALFLITTYVSLLVGHSVGMHRLMIHRTFECAKPVERTLIYVGVLVGVAGPFGIIGIHDTRDWAQRQSRCHDFFAHTKSLPLDLLWQLAFRFRFNRPPKLTIESHFADDSFYRFLDWSWRWHQLPLATAFYFFGGWGWVVWGICARVFVSAAGHWTITYFCHNPGPGRWTVRNAAVQASNVPGLGLLTYGECWHNNHHAFPESAQIGLYPRQTDPGWSLIKLLQRCGLAWNIGQPRQVHDREDLLEASPY